MTQTHEAVDESLKNGTAPAQHLSGMRLVSEIGHGGMGSVWLAMDDRLGRTVAVKLLKPEYVANEVVRTRFMQEACAIARLNHPNIVRIYNLGDTNEPPHYVMEYVQGVPLDAAARKLDLRKKVELFRKVVLAVAYLHDNDIVHRDLKPRNVLVDADLEPKLLDFGLARVLEDAHRLTYSGELIGTPYYFSPEQTFADATVDPRSDVFALGTVLYELLTGTLPFHGETIAEQALEIRQSDPELPRRLNAAIPGDLQNICMKALEKDPSLRYSSAREFANDLARFLAHEPVVAAPTVYSRMITGKIEQHVRDIKGWLDDQVITEFDFTKLRRAYDRLVEKEDAWLMELRRLSLSQVSQYLGAWVMVVGAALIFLFKYQHMTRGRALGLVLAAFIPTFWAGVKLWRSGQHRGGITYLLATCLLLPTTLLVAFQQFHWLNWLSQGKSGLDPLVGKEALNDTTNAQIWWAIFCSLPVYAWLRRFTRASVFSLVMAFMTAVLCGVSLLRKGLIEWIDNDPGKAYLHLLPWALLFFVVGILLERVQLTSDSQYWYPFAVVATFTALSGLAGQHQEYGEWLKNTFYWSDGTREYLFLINAATYYFLQSGAEMVGTTQMRNVATVFRFTIPGHVMFPMMILGYQAWEKWDGYKGGDAIVLAAYQVEARTWEFMLPAIACVFVFWSISKNMKNYVASGLFFLALSILQIQFEYYRDRAIWPVMLLIGGALIMALATNYAGIRVLIVKFLRRS